MTKNKITALLGTLGIILGSCSKLIDGYDVNPNTALDAPSTLQLTGAELTQGFIMTDEAARTASIWSGVFTGSDRQYDGLQNYITSASDYDGSWGGSYQGTIAQLRIVENKARAVGNNQLLGIAEVVEAQMIGTVADLWGDVPYSTAFDVIANPTPTFDPQKSVFTATQALLSTAIADLGKGGSANVPADIFFSGKKTAWLATAHSLKARYYLHVKDYTNAAVEARLGISSPAGDMVVPFQGGAIGSSANPYYSFVTNDRTGYLTANSSYAAQLLLSRNNAKTQETVRYNYYFDERGAPAVPRDLNVTDGAFQATSSLPLVSYVETQAILAEGLARTGNAPGALSALNAIRAANKAAYTGTGAQYDAYTNGDFASGGLLNPAAAGKTSDQALLQEILVEKYLSLIGQIEEFNDVRRTNNLIGVPKNVATAPSLPQRFLYPQGEINTNPNVPNPIPGLYVKTPVNQ